MDTRFSSPATAKSVPSGAAVDYLTLRKLMEESAFIGYTVVAQLSIQRNQLGPHHFRDGNRIVPIRLASLERAQGADDYVTLSTTTKQHLVSIRLSDLEQRLQGASFLRIHRSHLINLKFVIAIESYDQARLQVVMKSGVRIVASRTGSKRLRDLAL